ncbi:hypothetical protein PYW07_006598 [Mythimna separata]|uniref:Uncharacterized protein n=1 Tax=Mythimna separata TaxID=271217 RepID=A0AAD7YWK8_MYTSE|nr:hypothetical protein PYW07_006598 [Mythimna separata]
MTTLADVVESQRMAMMSINQRMTNFEVHLKESQPGADLSGLHKDFSAFKVHVWSVLSALQLQIAELSRSTDVIEMRHRKKFLLLGGVPETPGEKTPEVTATILQSKLGLTNMSPSSLIVCHRLGVASEGRARPILFRCADNTVRGVIWKTKTKLKGSSYVVSEFLTRQRQSAFSTARRLFGVTNVWTMDGNINVKLPDGKRRRVFSLEEVVALGEEHGRQLDQDTPSVSTTKSNNASAQASTPASGRSRRIVKKK